MLRIPLVVIAILLAMGQVSLAQRTDLRIGLDVNHLDRITRANARVAAKQASVESDPAKPIFHLMPAAGSGGDPNGVIYAKGKYHVFFQHAPEFEWGKPPEQWEEGQPGYSNTGWGHASSKDLVSWEHEPIALMPERGSYDPNFCASGCTVIADDGTPTIFYTAAEPQTQCIARSQDRNLRWWLKDERNPILREPDVEDYVKGGFRDPFIWREGTTWQMIVCGAIRGAGGTVLNFRSEDLINWTYVKPLCTGMGEHCIAWECPNFLLFGDVGLLIVSPLFDNLQDTDHAPRGAASYTIAPYGGNGDFTPGPWKSIDICGPNNFYATNALKTPDGRWLLWGMNLGGGSPGRHWTTNLSLPRVLTLRADGLLGQEPPVELQNLRGAHWGERDKSINGEYPLGVQSNTCEIIVEFEVGNAKVVGLDVRASTDFTSRNRVAYDVENARLHVDGHSAALEVLRDEDVLRLHVFVDRSVLEVFVNRRECGTLKRLDKLEDRAMRLFSEGGTARIRSVDVWELSSIWQHPAGT